MLAIKYALVVVLQQVRLIVVVAMVEKIDVCLRLLQEMVEFCRR